MRPARLLMPDGRMQLRLDCEPRWLDIHQRCVFDMDLALCLCKRMQAGDTGSAGGCAARGSCCSGSNGRNDLCEWVSNTIKDVQPLCSAANTSAAAQLHT